MLDQYVEYFKLYSQSVQSAAASCGEDRSNTTLASMM